MARWREEIQEVSTNIGIAFPWNRYHATPWERHVNEGAVEWPPSPWRLLRALYATWLARAPYLDRTVVVGLLGQLTCLPTYRLPMSLLGHTRHYLPDGRRDPQQIQGREGTDKALDGFAAVERGGELLVSWPVDLGRDQREALSDLARLLPYLGRAESLCEARVLDGNLPPERIGDQALAPRIDEPSSTRLLAPRSPLDLNALSVRTADLRRARLLRPPGAFWASYDEVQETLPIAARPVRRRPEPATVLRWAIDGPALPSVTATVAVADRLRSAAQSRYGELHRDSPSRLLSGKADDAAPLKGHQHAHYLPVDADGDGLLDELYLWCPAGLDAGEVAACTRIDRLSPGSPQAGFQHVRAALLSVGRREEVGSFLVGPAQVWVSATPFAPPRHSKLDWPDHVRKQVDEELTRRTLPLPVEIRAVPGHPPWLSFRRYRLKERLADSRRAAGLQLTFAEPVYGPLALGALSHLGLGLFLPAG